MTLPRAAIGALQSGALMLLVLALGGCSEETASVTCPDFDHMRRAAAMNGHFDVWLTRGSGDITQWRIDRQRALISSIRAWADQQPDRCVKAAYLAESDTWSSAADDAQHDLDHAPEIAASEAGEKKTRDEDWEALQRARAALPSPTLGDHE